MIQKIHRFKESFVVKKLSLASDSFAFEATFHRRGFSVLFYNVLSTFSVSHFRVTFPSPK